MRLGGSLSEKMEATSQWSQRAFTLMELLVGAAILSGVVLAMGFFLASITSRIADGEKKLELERDAHLLMESLRKVFLEAMEIRVPAILPGVGDSSFTALFWPEPFMDENRNGTWDQMGARGPCSPMECFEDLNGDGIWNREMKPSISFWKGLSGELFFSEGNGPVSSYFDPEKGYEVEEFSVSVSLEEEKWLIRFTITARGGSLSPGGGDVIRKRVEFSVPRKLT